MDQENGTPPEHTVLEESFVHTLADGCIITVFKPQGVLRVRLRNLLGDVFSKDDEFKNIATAFLCIKKWSSVPSPLNNPNQFEALMARFKDDADLDEFMEKYSKLTQPELSKILADTMFEAMDKGLNDEQTKELVRERTLPFAKARLERLRD